MSSYNAYAGTFIALLAGLGSTTILAVVLRLLARRKAGVGFGLEDACAIFALVADLIYLSTAVWGESSFYLTSICISHMILGAENGAGYVPTEVPLPIIEIYLKVLFHRVLSTQMLTMTRLPM